METKYVCRKCGSENIELQAWYNPNTNHVSDWIDHDCWCHDCEDETRWTTKIVISPSEAMNYELEDEDSSLGGTKRFGVTLAGFMKNADIPYTASIEDIDGALKECGIKPIFEHQLLLI